MTDRYEPVRATLPDTMPAITRVEAQKAANRIWRKFVPKAQQLNVERRVRRCWISRSSTRGHWKGWGRLVHDLSHQVFRRIYRGSRRPHDPLHAKYEADIAAYVVEMGWLDGRLKQKVRVKARPAPSDKLVRTEAAIRRWESKAKRAAAALSKLRRQRGRFAKLAAVSNVNSRRDASEVAPTM